jgi:hypothetical protein
VTPGLSPVSVSFQGIKKVNWDEVPVDPALAEHNRNILQQPPDVQSSEADRTVAEFYYGRPFELYVICTCPAIQ